VQDVVGGSFQQGSDNSNHAEGGSNMESMGVPTVIPPEPCTAHSAGEVCTGGGLTGFVSHEQQVVMVDDHYLEEGCQEFGGTIWDDFDEEGGEASAGAAACGDSNAGSLHQLEVTVLDDDNATGQHAAKQHGSTWPGKKESFGNKLDAPYRSAFCAFTGVTERNDCFR
jgi:hypothetical protein